MAAQDVHRVAADDIKNQPQSSRDQAAVIAMRLLREGHPELAVKALEAAADWGSPVSSDADDLMASACASLNRALMQLESAAAYDLLRNWTISGSPPTALRQLTALVSTEAPPQEFARALGERPSNKSFPISSIGQVCGIYSTTWALVTSARETGRLKQLMAELELLVHQKVAGADQLMTLAKIADYRGDLSKVAERLTAMANQLNRVVSPANADAKTLDAITIVIAVAALDHPTLRPQAEELIGAMIAKSGEQTSPSMTSFLSQARASVNLRNTHRQNDDLSATMNSRLKYWIPVSMNPSLSGLRDTSWLTHENHVLQMSASSNDSLLFRYPLSGNFRFQCETRVDGLAEANGGIAYGGLSYQTASRKGEFYVNEIGGKRLESKACPFALQSQLPGFSRIGLTSELETATVTVNLHPFWIDRSNSKNWLRLTECDQSGALFRNLKITGSPVIPRSIRMGDGDRLFSWQARTTVDRKNEKTHTNVEWRIAQGVISPPQHVESSPSKQLLSYQRPLLAGETITYEFFHDPNGADISPALGRMAFLLQPDGVRIHWVTDGDQDWTSLRADNSVLESLNRRGPRPLPYKVNEWNLLVLQRTDQGVVLSLNDVEIYQRPIDWDGDLRFGLYCQGATDRASVRNIVMTGKWPDVLPPEVLENLTATIDDPQQATDRSAFQKIFHEDVLASNAPAVRRKARSMPLNKRFKLLSDWILPGPDHASFRLTGEFTPTRPAPVVLGPGMKGTELGGQINSSVFDWLDTARELGRLSDCRQMVETAVANDDELQQRSRLCLLLLLSLEQGGPAANPTEWETLFALLKSAESIESPNHWPEMLLAVRGIKNSPGNPLSVDLVNELATQRMLHWRRPDIDVWHNHLAALFVPTQIRRMNESRSVPDNAGAMREWIPVTAGRSSTSAAGNPNARWVRYDDKVFKVAGHDADYLFYQLPLSGDFQVECELIYPPLNPVGLLVAGAHAGPAASLAGLDVGTIRTVSSTIPFQPALKPLGKPVHYRGVVRGGTRTIYLNGRQVSSEELQVPIDPWIAIRSSDRFQRAVQDVRITGNPTILHAVPLSNSKVLTGWLNYHEEGGWGYVPQPETNGWIVDHRNTALAGSIAESLLRYQRPLVEDGSIEYEFFFEPGVVEVHPALDRLAFVLEPDGVREHWITDGRHDQSELVPDNRVDVPANRRGPTRLPLNRRNWNRLRLSLRGATVELSLNGTVVYERELESTNQRSFGLFHEVDATEARVRIVVMRGDWPKSLPAVSEQELASQATNFLDQDLPRLKSVFTHDFAKEGLPEKFFELPVPNLIQATPEGALVTQAKRKDPQVWDISARFAVGGDFDLEATFANFQIENRTEHCGLLLRAAIDAPEFPVHDIHRNIDQIGQPMLQASRWVSAPAITGRNQLLVEVSPNEAETGRLRLCRRGGKIYSLFAEGDSNNFRLMGVEDALPNNTLRNGARIEVYNFGGETKVLWKNITPRAERMTWHPDPAKNNIATLKVFQADGSGSRTVVVPSKAGFRYVGSPEWSADGRKLIFDLSGGDVNSSHVGIVNVDGTELIDLGPGAMPSFSKDGNRIVFSSSGEGIMNMKSDGTDRQQIDRQGWGTQWSPDGKWIAYSKGGNLTLVEVATKKTRQLFTGDLATRYGYIYWNLGWSHDSRSIAFFGNRRAANRMELAVMDLNSREGPDVLLTNPAGAHYDLTFSPDNERVVFGMKSEINKGNQAFAVSRKEPETRKLLDFIPLNQLVDGISWSHDGKSVAVVVLESTEPVEWESGMK